MTIQNRVNFVIVLKMGRCSYLLEGPPTFTVQYYNGIWYTCLDELSWEEVDGPPERVLHPAPVRGILGQQAAVRHQCFGLIIHQ